MGLLNTGRAGLICGFIVVPICPFPFPWDCARRARLAAAFQYPGAFLASVPIVSSDALRAGATPNGGHARRSGMLKGEFHQHGYPCNCPPAGAVCPARQSRGFGCTDVAAGLRVISECPGPLLASFLL